MLELMPGLQELILQQQYILKHAAIHIPFRLPIKGDSERAEFCLLDFSSHPVTFQQPRCSLRGQNMVSSHAHLQAGLQVDQNLSDRGIKYVQPDQASKLQTF